MIKQIFKTFSLCCYVALLGKGRRRCFHGINAMILMPQIFDVIANENARYNRDELEYSLIKSVNCLLTSDFLVLFIPLSENMNAMCRN